MYAITFICEEITDLNMNVLFSPLRKPPASGYDVSPVLLNNTGFYKKSELSLNTCQITPLTNAASSLHMTLETEGACSMEEMRSALFYEV